MTWKRGIGLLLALTLLLSGCGAPEEELSEMLPWYGEEQGEEPEPPEEDRLTAFCLAYHRGQTLDPVTCGEGVQRQVADLLYEPLFALDRNFAPEEVLCDSYTVSEDGLSWVFHLRSGVRFGDGSELTPADVTATLRRAMTSQRYGSRLSGIRSVTASGDNAVQIQLRQPNGGLPALLDIPIVKAGSEGSTVPAGTGPYLYITDGDSACLRRNGDWWQGNGQPVEEIPLIDAKDTDAVQYLFTSRETHAYAVQLAGSTSVLTGSFDCTDAPTGVMQYIVLNIANPLLADSRVRRALSAGIDRETVVSGYLSGHGSAAAFPVPPQSELYPETKSYRLEGFLQAMEDAGLRTGEPRTLRLLVNEEGAEKLAIAQYLSEALSVYDLTVTLETLPWAEYMAALETGNFDLCYAEVKLTADWDISGLTGTGGALNYGGYTEETMDTLLSDFRAARDRKSTAAALYTRFEQECPILPVCFTSISLLTHRDTVVGVQPTASNLFRNFTGWTIRLQET